MVNITAVARSADGKLLGNLTRDDFEVIEDGVPQPIQFFARETELPLSLGLIIDVSGSQDKFLKQHNRDVGTFLSTVLRPSDQVFAVCFGNHLHLVGDGSSSGSAIAEGLERFQKGSEKFPEIGPKEGRDLGTALYDAIYFSIAEKLKTRGNAGAPSLSSATARKTRASTICWTQLKRPKTRTRWCIPFATRRRSVASLLPGTSTAFA